MTADLPAIRARADAATPETTFVAHWAEIVAPGGQWDHDQVKRELHDYWFMLMQVPLVYDDVTNGAISKPNTYAFEVIGIANERLDRVTDQRDEARATLQAVLDLHPKTSLLGGHNTLPWCHTCMVLAPCPTRRLIEGTEP